MNIFKKLFCSHSSYKTHVKDVREWTRIELVDGTQHWYRPIRERVNYSETTEILICEHCGKIVTLKY